jgi:RHS repeat-associated protein
MSNMAGMHGLTRVGRSIGSALLATALTVFCGAATPNGPSLISSARAASADAYVTTAAVVDAVAAGRTPGMFSVSQSGSATYRLPLWTPPGVGEVDLDLALVYTSRSGSGTLGVGWSLSGLSTITRCNRTVAQDGAAGGVSNTLTDRYCLDGQQLKLVSGAHGVAGAVYATEVETFSRIVANGSAGNGPQSFVVTTRNGLVYEYGTTADSRVFAGNSGTVRAWALSRVRDRAGGVTGTGNAITLSYANDAQSGSYGNGTQRIASIAYPTTATGAGPFYRVDFAYSARPANDVPSGYLAGNPVREPYQLDRISIQEAGAAAPFKSYSLSYESAPVTGRLRLVGVQECAVTRCLWPTTITYQNGAAGWQPMTDTGVVASTGRNPMPLELNGDGITDLLYPVDAGGGRMGWRILLGTTNGFAAPFDTGLVTPAAPTIIPGQFAGNGRTQFLLVVNGYWHVAGYTDAGFTVASTGLTPGGEHSAADIDGDGLADLLSQFNGTPTTISVRRNLATPSRTSLAVQFATTAQFVYSVPVQRQTRPWDNLRIADLNGDGRADIVVLSFNSSDRSERFLATPLLSNGFGAAFTVGANKLLWSESMVTMGDWNADGCSDIIQVHSVFISDCASGFIELGTGASSATGNTLYTALPADWNGDGRTDLLYIDATTRRWFVVPSTGLGAAPRRNTGIAAPTSTAWFDLDADGDGLTDLAYRDGNNGNRLRYHLHAAPATPADLATGFVDGFGMRQNPLYASIARSNYTKLADAVFPAIDFQGPLYVVSEFSADDGRGGTYRNSLSYTGAAIHLQGRGFQGFAEQRIQDSRHGLITIDYVARGFPFTGMHSRRTVLQVDGRTRVSDWSASLIARITGGTGSEQRLLPLLGSTTDQRFEFGGALNGTPVTETTTGFTYGDSYGNPTQVEVSTRDTDPGSPYFGSVWRTSARFGYVNAASDQWCLGLPASSTVTNTAPGQVAVSRTTTYAADTAACRITQQVLEPNTPAQKVTSTFAFDDCGNLSSVRVEGANPNGTPMAARTSSFSYGSRCQLPESATNALAQTTSYAWRYDFGVPTRLTDANGLSTTWTQDEFGRRVSETAPDGTRRTREYRSCYAGPCWGLNELRFAEFDRSYGSDGVLTREQQKYYDGHERLTLAAGHGALGAWVQRRYGYDALGRAIQESRPYSSASNGQTARTFDPLGRLTLERDFDAGGTVVRSVTLAYAGRTTSLTDGLGRTHTRITDVGGRLRRVVDPAPGGTTRYEYDSFGNLQRAEDAGGAVSTGSYDARGFRTQWSDSDAGSWTYSHNSLGELVAWTDGKGQSFGAAYDALGRRVSRTESEGISRWTWGASAANRDIGQLRSRSGSGVTELRSYDAVGRISWRRITTDRAYQYDFSYNTIGAVDSLTYPSSPIPTGQSGGRFKIRYYYSFGLPSQIDDVTQSKVRTLWKLGAVNDFDAPTQESFGTAVSRSSTYDAATQRLTALQAGTAGAGGNRQNLSYRWDAAGNLQQRRDLNQNLAEAFNYDGIDRLTGSTLNGVTNLSVAYDAAGNIKNKSDVGNYSYGDPLRPHAVTAAGSESFSYDRNGNLASRNGLAQEWASYNLPVTLRKPGFEAQFAYGPDRERWRQVASYQNGIETTYYAGGLLEKESTTSTGLTYSRHYVPTPGGSTIVVSRNSDGSATTTYLLPDHLGSSDTFLDESGATVARASYTAFGSRRGSNWNAGTAPDWLGIANTTRQGFTGHETLDNVGLVHMNGRVYDPTLGRFLSADPLLADPGDSQSLNPYAYVGNRPLNATDPSGMAVQLLACGPVCLSVAVSALSSVFNFIGHGHGSPPPPPPATALPGWSAQSGAPLCGAGTFSPTCGGMILYAATPGLGAGGPATSSWAESGAEEDYSDGNLQRFFIDLGVNAVDVLILAPVHDAADAYSAAQRGDYAMAVFYTGFTICDVAKPCQSFLAPTKALRRAARSTRSAVGRDTEIVQRAMSRAELEATLQTGLLRGGRAGTHYVSDAVNSSASRAQSRLALPTRPAVRTTLEVPRGVFSASAEVVPLRLPNGTVLPGGGSERTAIGEIPVRIIKVDDL